MIQSESDNTLTSRQKCWRSGNHKMLRSECQLFARNTTLNKSKKQTAITPSPPLLQMQLRLALISLALLCCCCCHCLIASAEFGGKSSPGRRLARSSSPYDQEDEELTIGQHFHQANFGGGGGADSTLGPPPPVVQGPQTRAQKRESLLVDPFVFTFEDYLREASGGSRGSGGAGDEDAEQLNRIAQPVDHSPAKSSDHDDDNDRQRQRAPSLVIEEEERDEADNNNIRPESRASGRERGKESAASVAEREQQIEGTGNRQDAGANEIGLPQFAWRALPTNKCSRACGRGQRLNHLSCVDLKFNVRVESELCAAKLAASKPSELSDEPCNELDCEPAWTELEYGKCGKGSDECPHGRGGVFKRLECAMLNARGQTIRLDESRCGAPTTASDSNRATSDDATTPAMPTTGGGGDELSIDLGEQIDKERNSILSNEAPLELDALLAPEEHNHLDRHAHTHHRHHREHQAKHSNEPFYEPGEWSACTGAPCGLLGKRSRELTCRLYLARSAKFVDLPEASCLANGARVLDREEPCYMDCGPASADNSSAAAARGEPSYSVLVHEDASHERRLSGELAARKSDDEHAHLGLSSGAGPIRETQLEDETIYDVEAARYSWRHGAWSACSAKCLGGTHESIVECWDKVAAASVEPAGRCEPRDKPAPLRRACNEIPCAPEWRLGPFSECSRTCGSAGVRSRTVACVQRAPPGYQSQVPSSLRPGSNELFEGTADQEPTEEELGMSYAISNHEHGHKQKQRQQHHQWLLVSSELCVERQRQQQQQVAAANTSDHSLLLMLLQDHLTPRSIEPCNRRDCPPEWQVGPWSPGECSAACGEITRNRTVICVQEFASRDGPLALEANVSHAIVSPDLREAIQLAARSSWHPGKAIQVPFSECYREFHSVPQLSERCRGHNCTASTTSRQTLASLSDPHQGHDDSDDASAESSSSSYIDSEPLQDFRMLAPDGVHLLTEGGAASMLRRKTITLKVGGRAQVLEGRNLKLRCRIISRRTRGGSGWRNQKPPAAAASTQYDLVGSSGRASAVEWHKDGVRVFAPGTTVADKRPIAAAVDIEDDEESLDNSITLGGVQAESGGGGGDDSDKYSLMASDEPEARRRQRFVAKRERPGAKPAASGARGSANKGTRVLRVRSWPDGASAATPAPPGSFRFVPQAGGRFSLVKENTLRIKRLRPDDSGSYTCSSGLLSETIELTVVRRRARNASTATTTTTTGNTNSENNNNPDQQIYNYT